MRVVILKSKARNNGGLEKTSDRIAKAFALRGEEVQILSGEKLIRWPAFLALEQYDRQVKKWVKKNSADIVFGMDRTTEQTHLRAGNGVHDAYLKSRILNEGKLKYYTCLCNPLHRKILKAEKAAFEFPGLKKLFVNSHMVKHEILERYSTDPAKIQVVHNGVEWFEMQSDFDSWSQKRDPNQFTFLFIGNGYLRKGLEQLLDGLALLKDVRLFVVGKDKNLEYYQRKAAKLQIKAHFFGPQNNIRPFYAQADALVIPSFYDPFANVTVEALAMGVNVISSKYNGGSEILKKQNIIENLLSPDSIAAALTEATAHPKTVKTAKEQRQSVKHLDYSHQMKTLIDACYE